MGLAEHKKGLNFASDRQIHFSYKLSSSKKVYELFGDAHKDSGQKDRFIAYAHRATPVDAKVDMIMHRTTVYDTKEV